MKAPVDVLAVMEAAARAMFDGSELGRQNGLEIQEARATVAELIDAVRNERLIVRSRRRPTPESLQQAIDRTDAALAKVGRAP